MGTPDHGKKWFFVIGYVPTMETKLPFETAATYGGTMFKRTGNLTAVVVDQLYHYDVRSVTGWRDILRNIMNEIGKPVRSVPGQPKERNNGVPFMIHYENPTINFKIIK